MEEAVPRIEENEPAPRKINRPGKSEDSSGGAISKELLADVWTALFWIPAQARQEPHWMLQDREAKLLADRTAGTIKGMDKKRAKAVQQMLDKYAPGVSLVIAVAMIAGPRVKASQQRNQSAFNSFDAQRREAGAEQPPAANTAEAGAAPVAGQAGAPTGGVTAVPATAADFAEWGGTPTRFD